MPERFRDLPKSLKLYDLALLGLALACSVWAVPRVHVSIGVWLIAIFWLACIVKPIPHPYGGIIHPISGVVQVAALLWQPQDVLLAVGIGCFCGLLLFQRVRLRRAGENAVGWALSASAAAAVAHRILLGISPLLLAVAVAAFLSIVVNHLVNKTIFALYRDLRFGYPSLAHLRDSLISRLLDEFSPFPMIVALAWAASLLRTIEWGLILTAVYLLVLPVPRRKVKGCFKDHDLMCEVAGDALRTLTQREQVGSWAEVLGRSMRRLWDRSVSPTLEGFTSVAPVAASILVAAEAYDNTRTMLASLPRPISCEDIERECIILTGTNPDPSIVPILLSVAENAKRPPS